MSIICALLIIALICTVLSMLNPSRCPPSVPVLLLTIAGLIGCFGK